MSPLIGRQLGKDNDAPGIDAIRVAGDERHPRVVGGGHHPHVGRLDDAHLADDVGVRLALAADDDLVAHLQPVEVAERLAVDVVVAGQDDIARPPRLAAVDVLADALLQLLPVVPLDDGVVAAQGGNLQPAGLFRARGGDGRRDVGVDDGQQVGGDAAGLARFRRCLLYTSRCV